MESLIPKNMQAARLRSHPELRGSLARLSGEQAPNEVVVERLEKAGWEVASEGGITVALDTSLDDELRRESRVYDLIHQVNTMRKDAGLGLSDRIGLTLPSSDADLLGYREWIAGEVLADSVQVGPTEKVAFEKYDSAKP